MRWEQLGDRSSRWTTGLGDRLFAAALFAFTLFHCGLAAKLPLSEDELYYWNWSRTLQWSYFDHPPMVAYWIRLTTAIFGNGPFGIRLGAVLIPTAVLLLLGRFARRRHILALAALTPGALLLSVFMTPDVPLALFWMLYAVWAVAVNRRFQDWSDDPMHRVYRQSPVPLALWALGGLVLGLGLLSKYTMGLAPLCLAILFGLNYRWRAWAPGILLHGLVAAIIASPILIYNLQHDFQPLQFQWHHALSSGRPSAFWEFVGVQALLFSGLPFLLLPWVLALRSRLCQAPELQVAYYLFLPPLVFFLFQAARGPLEANWSLVAYLTFWPLAETLFHDNSFKTEGRIFQALALAPSYGVGALLLVHLISPLKFVPPAGDRYRVMAAKQAVAAQIAEDWKANPPAAILFTPTYQWTASMRYYGVPAEAIPAGRPNHFLMDYPRNPCSEGTAVALVENGTPNPIFACFSLRRPLFRHPYSVRGTVVGVTQLDRFAKKGGR